MLPTIATIVGMTATLAGREASRGRSRTGNGVVTQLASIVVLGGFNRIQAVVVVVIIIAMMLVIAVVAGVTADGAGVEVFAAAWRFTGIPHGDTFGDRYEEKRAQNIQ